MYTPPTPLAVTRHTGLRHTYMYVYMFSQHFTISREICRPRKCAFLWALVYFAGVTMYIDTQIKLCCQSAVLDPNSEYIHYEQISMSAHNYIMTD
jgi:hypothetical protein